MKFCHNGPPSLLQCVYYHLRHVRQKKKNGSPEPILVFFQSENGPPAFSTLGGPFGAGRCVDCVCGVCLRPWSVDTDVFRAFSARYHARRHVCATRTRTFGGKASLLASLFDGEEVLCHVVRTQVVSTCFEAHDSVVRRCEMCKKNMVCFLSHMFNRRKNC